MNPQTPSLFDRDMIGRTLLGRYRLVRRLGSGGMGIVYLANAKGAAGFIKPVVVKLILPGFDSSQRFSNMFIREAKILSRLKDPAIVDVIDFAEEDGLYFMVLEYVNGYQLRQWLEYLKSKGRRIPTNVCIQIVIAVCDALHYAHNIESPDGTAIQVIHRDISTPNILLDTDGHVKLVDFGIARISGIAQEYVTEEATFKGKLPYTAPELFSGSQASVSSDVYACGVVLHEILTGENFFAGAGNGFAETVARVLNMVVPSVHGFREDAPDDIDAVIGKDLAKSPAERYQTAHQFAQALRELHPSSEREAIELLRELVRADFGEDMAAFLRVESLQSLEKLWRNPSLDPSPLTENMATDKADYTPTSVVSAPHHTAVEKLSGGLNTVVANRSIVDPIIQSELSSGGARMVISGRDRTPSKLVWPAVEVEQHASKSGLVSRATKRLIWVAATALLIAAAIVITTKIIRPNKENRQFLLIQSPVEPTGAAVAVATARNNEPSTQAGAAPNQKEQATEPHVNTNVTAVRKPTSISSLDTRTATKVKSPNAQLVTRAFRKREKEIQDCFQRHAKELQGKPQIVVHFQVDPSGSVERATLTPPTLVETVLGKCLLSVAKSTQFPRQKDTISFRIPLTTQRISNSAP
jgi:serine/threonine-protein kinase